MGVCAPPSRFFFISDFVLDFLQVLSKLSQASMVQMSHFSDKWKVVSVASQRGGIHPPHKSRGVFSDILTTATRLNTFYVLET